jgi:GNAT superfamily N-acetyltransferase
MKEPSKSQNKFHITIREAKATDSASIARIDVDTGQTTYTGIMPKDYLDSRTYEQRTSVWQSRYSDSDRLWHGWFVYVAEDNGRNVVGFAGGGPQHGEVRGYSGELGFIYLLKSYQRRGIGRQLTGVIVNRLKQQGHTSMLVWVLAAKPYRSFYESLGGQIVGEKEVNFGGKFIKEIAYGWRDLSVFEKILKTGAKS